jgi:hypothetical protein
MANNQSRTYKISGWKSEQKGISNLWFVLFLNKQAIMSSNSTISLKKIEDIKPF